MARNHQSIIDLFVIILLPELTPATAQGGLGLVSIAVGLAFKDIFEYFCAGIFILWRFSFELDYYIECEGLVGKIEKVTMLMSYIREAKGKLTVDPNAFLFKNPMTILNSFPGRRVVITTGVDYVDVEETAGVIRGPTAQRDALMPDKPIQVFPCAFDSSSVDIELAWWTDSFPLGVRRSPTQVVTAVKPALDSYDIEIPFLYWISTFKEPLSFSSNNVGGVCP